MGSWRDSLSPKIKEELERLLSLTAEEEKAYKQAKYPSSAQLWCALALLAKENEKLSKDIWDLKELFLFTKHKTTSVEEALTKLLKENLAGML